MKTASVEIWQVQWDDDNNTRHKLFGEESKARDFLIKSYSQYWQRVFDEDAPEYTTENLEILLEEGIEKGRVYALNIEPIWLHDCRILKIKNKL